MSHVETQTIEGLSRELGAASSPFLNLELGAFEAFGLLGSIQLSIRHPGMSTELREVLRGIAEGLECQLASLGPVTRECCRMGWLETADFDAA
jgi:hypothetical protein